MTFQKGQKTKTYGGSGWLIDNSTVVTAAHNLYDPVRKHFAIKIAVHIGITNGKKKRHPRVETRAAQYAAVHWGYFAANLRQNDFAVLKLQNGFDEVTPIECKDAAPSGKIHLEVVGYPGDMGVKGRDEGWVMYTSHGDYRYDLVNDDYLLHHKCDTYPGNSGGPIFEVDDEGNLKAIGVHCNGDFTGDLYNSGPPLGHNANDIEKFREAMSIARNGVAVAQNPFSSVEPGKTSVVPGMKKISIPY